MKRGWLDSNCWVLELIYPLQVLLKCFYERCVCNDCFWK